ncbi:hypothetical protein [Streptomyces sp. I05A-00742]|uniref:hypothetical protein n=1 Tax=Streptomyces sp. I05A-00742 TaxID=2732853 RepID=UPI0014887F6E|nr:hypothetical protein [Streptomyces sp. I05A-00742]
MSAGDPPHLPDPPGNTPFWSRVWAYWVTGGMAIVLGALLPVLLQDGSSDDKGNPPPTPPSTSPLSSTAAPVSTGPAPPPPPGPTTPHPPSVQPSTTPPSATPTLRVSGSVTSVLSKGSAGVGITKVQVNVTLNGLKGRTAYIKWHTYSDLTKQSLSVDTVVHSPVLNWDVTNWHPTFLVSNPSVHWQLQVTAYGPDGTRLATNHSNFTFSS